MTAGVAEHLRRLSDLAGRLAAVIEAENPAKALPMIKLRGRR
jgi:hypothetical protein